MIRMKLELKHITPYLPYKVKVSSIHHLNARNGIGGIEHILTTKNNNFKLHLRPLSDLTKEYLELNNKDSVGRWSLICKYEYKYILDCVYYNEMQFLLEHHFDVFGLIEKGLAIDINTLEA